MVTNGGSLVVPGLSAAGAVSQGVVLQTGAITGPRCPEPVELLVVEQWQDVAQ